MFGSQTHYSNLELTIRYKKIMNILEIHKWAIKPCKAMVVEGRSLKEIASIAILIKRFYL